MPGGGGLIVGGDDERLLMLAKVLSLPSGLGVGVGRIAQRVWVSGEEARLEDRVSLRFPAPWPLPRLEVTATLYSSLQVTLTHPNSSPSPSPSPSLNPNPNCTRACKFACYMWEGYTTAHETRVRHTQVRKLGSKQAE